MFIKKLDKKLEELYPDLKNKHSRMEFMQKLGEIAENNEHLINSHENEGIKKKKRKLKIMKKYNGSASIKDIACENLLCLVKIKHQQIEDVEFIPKCEYGEFGVCHILKKFIIGRNIDEILKSHIGDLKDFYDMLLPEYQHCYDIAMSALRRAISDYYDHYYEKFVNKERKKKILEDTKNTAILNQCIDFPW